MSRIFIRNYMYYEPNFILITKSARGTAYVGKYPGQLFGTPLLPAEKVSCPQGANYLLSMGGGGYAFTNDLKKKVKN